ncbi:hypothetical protein B0H14DRAFT_3178540 [Mycena olivaceomarginata]|nr:hypothetical protein B0H14DRAFT_3178540 [Mycena olivaceomarginata]
MPPKGSGKVQETDFRFNEDRTKVQCKICIGRETWIAARSAAAHLLAATHLQAVRLVAERSAEIQRRTENLERERQADSATDELRDIQFAAHHFPGPVAAKSSGMSAAEAEMWEDYRVNGAEFSAGDPPDDPEAQHRELRRQAETFGLWNPVAMARRLGFGDDTVAGEIEDDPEDDFLAEILGNIGLQEPEPSEIQNGAENAERSNPWFPYPSRMARMFLLDTLDNLPRLRVSSSLMRVFLWVLKEVHCKDVPSFDHLRRFQKGLRAECGIPSIPCKSVQGNVFFMNDPRAIIAKDWANPSTRKHIHVYPEIPEDGVIREVWHAQKWRKDMDLDILSPMYDSGVSHYYVNEVSRLSNGNLVIPIRWIKFRGGIYADSFSLAYNDKGEATIVDTETILIRAKDLTENYYDLEHSGSIPNWAASTVEASYPARMPNPKRVAAAGRPMYSSFINYFSDDVSGNRSKSWNKHWNGYMTHQNLPREILQQEFHVHFVSTSPNASVAEQFVEFKAAFKMSREGSTCFSIYVDTGLSDNPMQSEICGHIGGKGNCYCRKCKVGGTQKDKATNDGYHTLFEAGVPRSKAQIIEELQKQVKLACAGVSKPVKASQTETGVKDTYTQFWIDGLITRFQQMKKEEPDRSIEEIQEELIQWTVDNRDKLYSPFLTMKGFDPAVDTPIEILHTILLGIIKYIWHVTHSPWSAEAKQTYATRLQSTNTDGLSIHAIRSAYIMQYAGSLIGRQFKTIAQTNIFHLRGLVSDDQFMAWRASGELAALMWVTEIRDLAEYRQDLKVAVANVLDAFTTIDPSKIITKIKYHLLVHADADVVRFGPLIGLASEGFESYNGVFRFCSILSNHLAPSRDIAIQLADQEGLKHRLTGGFWPSGADQKWTQAGSGVRDFLSKHPILQKLVGWTEKKAGDIKLVSLEHGQKDRVSHSLESTNAARAVNYGLYSPRSMWRKCKFVVSESLDECFIDSWVFAKSPMAEDSTIPGRISDILVDGAGIVLVVLEPFQVLTSRDEMYGMPILNIKFKFNVQHDCHSANCEASGVRLRMQERVESDQIEKYIVHESLDRFIINTHAFHNAHLLRATLPRIWSSLFLSSPTGNPNIIASRQNFGTPKQNDKPLLPLRNGPVWTMMPMQKKRNHGHARSEKVKPTAKAKAAAAMESDEEEILFADSEDDSEEDDLYDLDSDDCAD